MNEYMKREIRSFKCFRVEQKAIHLTGTHNTERTNERALLVFVHYFLSTFENDEFRVKMFTFVLPISVHRLIHKIENRFETAQFAVAIHLLFADGRARSGYERVFYDWRKEEHSKLYQMQKQNELKRATLSSYFSDHFFLVPLAINALVSKFTIFCTL